MALEEAFDIDEAAEGITTVDDAVKYIEDKQAEEQHGGRSSRRRHRARRGYTDRQHGSGLEWPHLRPPELGITLFDASSHACRFAAEVKAFDPSGD